MFVAFLCEELSNVRR